MNLKIVINFVIAVALQVFVFNFAGNFTNYLPYFGLIAVILFPFRLSKSLYLLYAFATGLSIDLSLGTGGVFAGASVGFAYLRDFIISRFRKDWSERKTELVHLSLNSLIIYIIMSSLLLTALVYMLDAASVKIVFYTWPHILKHAAINAFFYLVFTLIFVWDNVYKTSVK